MSHAKDLIQDKESAIKNAEKGGLNETAIAPLRNLLQRPFTKNE